MFQKWLSKSGWLCVLVFLSCSTEQETQRHSKIFTDFFYPAKTKTTPFFRGVLPGDSLSKVLRFESGTPRYSDELGLAFAYELTPKGQLNLNYYTKPERTDHKVYAIEASVSQKDKKAILAFYEEAFSYLSEVYGKPTGETGEESWVVTGKPGYLLELNLDGSREKVELLITQQ